MKRKLLAAAICGTLSALGLVALSAPASAAPLRDVIGNRFIGYALNLSAQSSDAQYRTVGAREFNIVTAENAMKFEATEPNQNQFTFGQADQVVAAAQANNQQIHGHTLVWHSQTSGWIQGMACTAQRAAMRNHISTVVGRYASSVRSWDVVNEALNEDGSLRSSFWFNSCGNEMYIDEAFRAADAADPDAELCINDFNTDGMGSKSNGMFALVQRLLQRGVPIDCVGFQGHLAIQFSFPSQVQANFQRFANLGLNVKITELDVRMQNPRDANKDTTQATYYRNMVTACVNIARCNQITIWGFTDRFSWVPDTFPSEGFALPYDNNYAAKPARAAIEQALGGTPTNDTTPPTAPGTPTVSNVTSNSASVAWAASTDTGGSGLAGYTVFREQGATDPPLATSTTNTAALTGLTPNTQYQIYVVARDGANNSSTASATVTFTTPAPTNDTTPPTQPGTPTVSGVTSNSASLAWTASTDTGGSGLAGYNVFRRQGTTDTLLTQTTTNSASLTGLTPSTQYVVVVRARDGAGNLSTPSGTATFTTPAGPGGTGPCRVTYSASNWGGGGGFTAGVTIANTGTSAINNWTLAFTYTAGQRITQPGWGATWTQPAASGNVTATPLSWNLTIAPNTSINIGFNGTFTGSNPAPTAFTLSGATCTTA